MKLLAAFSLALIGILDADAQGLIWSADHWAENDAVLPGASWEIAFDHVSEVSAFPPSANTATRIFSMTLATNDSGRTFVANAMNEPGFAGFVAGLTDGTNGWLRFQDGSPSAWFRQSEELFLGRPSNAPDLAGYDITEVAFRVNSFYDWYDHTEGRYFRTLEYSLDFYAVPEPSTRALLGLGAAALMMRRRTRRLFRP
jgi:hypothetical protein